jgi:hypothetical protein
MALEWLRRHDAVLDRYLRLYLFTEGTIVDKEPGDGALPASLGIGSMRGSS